MEQVIIAKRDKRLKREAEENKKPSHCFYVQPLQSDILTWHFTLIGIPDTPYENGIYHGYITLPSNYPMSPPDLYFLNESGRYSTNTKICLNITSYHKDTWSPAWGLRTIMEAFSAYFFIQGSGIGSLYESDEQRKQKAKKSRNFKCSQCGDLTKIENLIRKDNDIFKKENNSKIQQKSQNKIKKIKKVKKVKKVKRKQQLIYMYI